MEKYKLIGVTERAEKRLTIEDLEAIKGMIGCEIEESENKAEIDKGRLFILPDGIETNECFLQIEPLNQITMSETKTAEEILKRNVEDIAKCNVTYNITNQGILNAMKEYANQQNQDLQRQVEELNLKHDTLLKSYNKVGDSHINLTNKYTQIKEAADEMARQMDEFYHGSENAEDFLTALETYKQLTNKP